MKNLLKLCYSGSMKTISIAVSLMFFSLNSWSEKEPCLVSDCVILQGIETFEELARDAEAAALYYDEVGSEHAYQLDEHIVIQQKAEQCRYSDFVDDECRDISYQENNRRMRAARHRMTEAKDTADMLRQKAEEFRQKAEELEQQLEQD